MNTNLNYERCIPSLIDGLHTDQRKVLFSCLKLNLTHELQVNKLARSVAELSEFTHDDPSLIRTIIGMAQDFVGANNLNLLLPNTGQFGTRIYGGQNADSAHKLTTCLHPLIRLLFNSKDDALLTYLNKDGKSLEPEWYCPILPLILVNGYEANGVNWTTSIPKYNINEIIENLKRFIKGEDHTEMTPFYKNFKGRIDRLDETSIITSGKIEFLGQNRFEITELPVSVWTHVYREEVLERFLRWDETILDYDESHTDTDVRFAIEMTPEQFEVAKSVGYYKFFKLRKTVTLENMVLFDSKGCLKRYDSVYEILREIFSVRKSLYMKRKEHMEFELYAASLKLANMARFVTEVIDGVVKVDQHIRHVLIERMYEPDSVGNYDYLLDILNGCQLVEKKDEISKQQKNIADELDRLKARTPGELWLDDLDEFAVELKKHEYKEKKISKERMHLNEF